jgi:hypothetical protein
MTRKVYLKIKLSEQRGLQFSTGRSRRWASFRGSLSDSQSRLDGTAFVLELFEGDYHPEKPGVPEAAIGVVNVTPHAQPSDGQVAPFHAMVCLARSDFDAALHLLDITLGEGHLAGACLTVQSDQFPLLEPNPYIHKIDLSSGFHGFVCEFSVTRSSGRRIPPHLQPVSLPEKPMQGNRAQESQ